MANSLTIDADAFMAAAEVVAATGSMAAIADLVEDHDPHLAALLRPKKLSMERPVSDSMIDGYATKILLRDVIGETDRDIQAAVISELHFDGDPHRASAINKVISSKLNIPEHVREAKARADWLKGRPAFIARLREIHARFSAANSPSIGSELPADRE